MNIKDFLIDNYIYIIIVIILTIITIIGFLADKKKNGSNKSKDDGSVQPNGNDQTVMSNQTMNYQSSVPTPGVNDLANNQGFMNQSNGFLNNNQVNNFSNPMPPVVETNNQIVPPTPVPMPQSSMQSPQSVNVGNQSFGTVPESVYASPMQSNVGMTEPMPSFNNTMPNNGMINPQPMPVPNQNVVPTPMPNTPGIVNTPLPMPNDSITPAGQVSQPSGNFVYGANQINNNNNNQFM